jgi:hypothetical protein
MERSIVVFWSIEGELAGERQAALKTPRVG